MSDTQSTVLEGLETQKRELGKEWDTLIDEREAAIAAFEQRTDATDEDRDAHAAAEEEFRTANADFDRRSSELEARIDVLKGREQRRAVQSVSPEARVTSEPSTYRPENQHDYAYFKDLLVTHSELRHLAPRGAEERISHHAKENNERLDRTSESRQREAAEQVNGAEKKFRGSFGLQGELSENPFERRANPSRETGHGGEFVPPKWEVDKWIPQLRAGRVIAPLARFPPFFRQR